MKKKVKKRVIFVNLFIILFAIYSYITVRGEYLQILGIGEKYVEIFKTNLCQKINVFIASFIIIYLLTYVTTLFIKKGLKKFFVEEKIEMPKLPNKSIALAFATIAGLIFSNLITEKAILAFNKTRFVKTEPVFNLDIGYYVFQKPFMESMLYSFIIVMAIMCIYITVYYLLSFRKYFTQGINMETLKNSTFLKQVTFYAFLIILAIAVFSITIVQDIVLGKFTTTRKWNFIIWCRIC